MLEEKAEAVKEGNLQETQYQCPPCLPCPSTSLSSSSPLPPRPPTPLPLQETKARHTMAAFYLQHAESRKSFGAQLRAGGALALNHIRESTKAPTAPSSSLSPFSNSKLFETLFNVFYSHHRPQFVKP